MANSPGSNDTKTSLEGNMKKVYGKLKKKMRGCKDSCNCKSCKE